jgi:hypothetical protein
LRTEATEFFFIVNPDIKTFTEQVRTTLIIYDTLNYIIFSFPLFFPPTTYTCSSSLPIMLHSRPFQARRMRWAGHVARMGEKRNAYRLLVGTPEGRRPLGRPRRRWLDYIRIDPVGVLWFGVDCIGLAQDRGRWRALVNSVLDLRVP